MKHINATAYIRTIARQKGRNLLPAERSENNLHASGKHQALQEQTGKKKKLKKKENEAKSSCTLILDLPKVAIYVRTLSGRWIYYKQHNQPAVFSKPHDSIPRSRPNQPTSTLFPGHSIQAGQSNLESKHTIQALITGIGFGLGSVGRLQAPAQNLRK